MVTDPLLMGENGVGYSSFHGLEHTCEVGEPDPDFDLKGRRLYKTARVDGRSIVVDADLEDAVVVGSRMGYAEFGGWDDSPERVMHRPVIDVDVPIRVVPSTTEGHSHLYIDKDIPFRDYLLLLEHMALCGIVEYGYYQGVKARGASYVRLPWVRKTA